MEEMTSFEKLEKAISEKDYISAKSYVVTSMRFDPRFESGISDRMLALLQEQAPEIFEEEKMLNYEDKLTDLSKWDERYYMQILVWFERNFAQSRIAHIKDVGKKVYPPKSSKTKESTHKTQKPHPTQAPKSKKTSPQNILMIAGAVVAVAAAVLLIIKVLK